MRKSEILVTQHALTPDQLTQLSHHFDIRHLPHDALPDEHLSESSHVLLVGYANQHAHALELCRRVRASSDLPVICIGESDALDAKLEAFAAGCDDYLPHDTTTDELLARIERSRYHKLANDQLRQRMEEASQLAFNAMSNSSDLGVVLNFLIDSTECSNLDQLGQMFFRAIGHYRLNCSLQLRSLQGVKNMEANGMARALESHLLWQLRDQGRFVDFGSRSVINYEDVSVLIRTVPSEDEQKRTQLKDNMLAMLKALQMRVRQLDDLQALQRERDMLRQVARRMPELTEKIRDAYYQTIKRIVSAMEEVSGNLSDTIPQLALSEQEEHTLVRTLEHGVSVTHQAFNEGLKIDDDFRKFVSLLQQTLAEPERLGQQPSGA